MKEQTTMFRKFAEAITGLTQELARWREERNRDLATKADILASEKRILEAVQVSDSDRRRLDAVLSRVNVTVKRVEKLSKALKKLDAQT